VLGLVRSLSFPRRSLLQLRYAVALFWVPQQPEQQWKLRLQFPLDHSAVYAHEAMIQAPGRAKYRLNKSSDLCEGCISLSSAEGF